MPKVLFWVLLFFGLVPVVPCVEIDMDLLIPYPQEYYNDAATRRYARSCVSAELGSSGYESFKPKAAVERTFRTDSFLVKIAGSIQYGHRTYVSDPLRMLSVLEPLHAMACEDRLRSTVSMSSLQRSCIVATNAGFFDPSSGKCLGNLVSDGRLVLNSKGVQNANFGVRQDGTIVVGYISESDILDTVNPYVQLISGVGWLIRNGSVYVRESLDAECADTQTTGTLQKFYLVQSARTAIGHDAFGNIHIFQFDGKTDSRGLNLYQVADYLWNQGIYNAINLDGGGSSTFVINGTVVNYPSDICKYSYGEMLCPRNVSSILCVHEPDECVSGTACRGNGRCLDGKCILSARNSSDAENKLRSRSLFDSACDRNYVLLIAVTAVCGLSVVFNICLANCYCLVRMRLTRITSGRSKAEALRNLLREADHDPYDGSESEWEEDDERAMQLRRLRNLDMIE